MGQPAQNQHSFKNLFLKLRQLKEIITMAKKKNAGVVKIFFYHAATFEQRLLLKQLFQFIAEFFHRTFDFFD